MIVKFTYKIDIFFRYYASYDNAVIESRDRSVIYKSLNYVQ